MDQIDELAEAMHEDAGTKALANRLSVLLLDADPFASLNALIVAAALLHADPATDRQVAIDQARDFGRLIAEEIEKNYQRLIDIRKKHEAGGTRDIDELVERLRAYALDEDGDLVLDSLDALRAAHLIDPRPV